MDVDSILLQPADLHVAFALTGALQKFGAEATYRNVRKSTIGLGLSGTERKELIERILGDNQLEDLLDLNRFNRNLWVTQEQSDALAFRLLTTLHPEGEEIRQAHAEAIGISKLLTLYSDEGRLLLGTIRSALASMSDDQLDVLHGELLPLAPEVVSQRTRNTTPYPKLLANQSWVRINMPDIGLHRANLLIPILAHTFTWHRYRAGDWRLAFQIQQIHLADAFLDAWDDARASASV